MAERITSRTNPLMTHIRKLSASRSCREKAGEYLGDGVKLLEEAVRWGADLTCVVFTPGSSLPPLPAGVRLVEIPRDVMASVSPMETPQGILFLARRPDTALPEVLSGRRYLALEGVQDPGNVGTILRSADAFEADGLILLPGCADPYGPKTVRASMGAVFRTQPVKADWAEVKAACAEAQIPVAVTALSRRAKDLRNADLRGMAVVIGSEGQGVRREILESADGELIIPMNPRCESLNAAVAAAIVMWQMKQ